jgi:hypothetical protein
VLLLDFREEVHGAGVRNSTWKTPAALSVAQSPVRRAARNPWGLGCSSDHVVNQHGAAHHDFRNGDLLDLALGPFGNAALRRGPGSSAEVRVRPGVVHRLDHLGRPSVKRSPIGRLIVVQAARVL